MATQANLTPTYSGPPLRLPDPVALRAALARRYPRHVIVRFDDQGLAEGEAPLEIPARPHPPPTPLPKDP